MEQAKRWLIVQKFLLMFGVGLYFFVFAVSEERFGQFSEKNVEPIVENTAMIEPEISEFPDVESNEIVTLLLDTVPSILPPLSDFSLRLIESDWRPVVGVDLMEQVSVWERVGESSGGYSFLRVERRYQFDSSVDEHWQLVSDAMMAADGLIVEYHEGMDASKVILFDGDELKVERIRDFSQVARLKLRGVQIDEFDRALNRLQQGDFGGVRISRDYAAFQSVLPNDPLYLSNQSDLDLIGAPMAWDITEGDADVVVAVVDSGIQSNHPDLASNLFQNPLEIPGNGVDDDGNGLIDDVTGWDFHVDDADPDDIDGHGTAMAGIVAAAGNNGLGVTGTAWNAKILPLKAGNGIIFWSSAIQAIDYAIGLKFNGVPIAAMNHSYAGSISDPTELGLLGDAFLRAEAADILMVTSSGNQGLDNDASGGTQQVYPSGLTTNTLLSVAATTASDRLASFSNFGSQTIDLAAPGTNVYTTLLGGGYGAINGTSGSSARVAGLAALLRSQNENLTAIQLRSILIDTSQTAPDLIGSIVNPVRVHAGFALTEARNYPDISWSDGASTLFLLADESTDLSAEAFDYNNDLVDVSFFTTGGVLLGADTDGSDGWSFPFSTTEGIGELIIIATDQSGRSTQIRGRDYQSLNSFDFWRFSNWGELYANEPMADSDADPDKDGISNLWEYAIGSNPMEGEADAWQMQYARPLFFVVNGTPAFGFAFRFRGVDSRLQFSLESSDLVTSWESVDDPSLSVVPDVESPEFINVHLGVTEESLEIGSQRFLRVHLNYE